MESAVTDDVDGTTSIPRERLTDTHPVYGCKIRDTTPAAFDDLVGPKPCVSETGGKTVPFGWLVVVDVVDVVELWKMISDQ